MLNNTNSSNCDLQLSDYGTSLNSKFQKRFYGKAEARSLISESVQNRLNLRKQLLGLNPTCDETLRKIFILQRDQEDYWALNSGIQQQVLVSNLKFDKQPVPLKENSTVYEKYVTAEGPQSSPFSFMDGDIMITRGVSWISATIAHSTSNKNHFSHGVFVTKDSNNTEHTIESYIGSGAKQYPIDTALKNENARIQVYRLKTIPILHISLL